MGMQVGKGWGVLLQSPHMPLYLWESTSHHTFTTTSLPTALLGWAELLQTLYR